MAFIELDHVGVIAHTWDDAAKVLLEQLGLEVDPNTPLPNGSYFAPEQTNNYMIKVGSGNTRVEVLIPQGKTSGTARYLDRFGPGLHHLGYACEDIAKETQRLLDAGMRRVDVARNPNQRPGRLPASFFHPKTAGGILTELVLYRPLR